MLTSKRIIPLLAALFFIGAFSWLWYLKQNTGVPWDEPWEQALAQKSWDYAIGKNTELLKVQNKYHGSAFETLTESVSQATDTHSFAGKLQIRRTVLIVFFLIGAVFLYLAAVEITNKGWLGLAAILMLFFTPRIMLHAAVNTKDIPILAAASFFIWAVVRYWKKYSVFNATLCGLGAALMISLRIPAIYVIILWIFVWTCGWFNPPGNKRNHIASLLTFIISMLLFTYACWPILWDNPIIRFHDAWVLMSRYPWENEVLFMGKFISALQLPAHYIPVWMAITIPLAWLLFFIIGLFTGLYLLVKRKKESVIFLFLVGFISTPIAAIVVLHSVVYDEWRHIFFIYPAFVLVCILGFQTLYTYHRRPAFIMTSLVIFFVLQIAEVAYWTAQHPRYTFVYFNSLLRNQTCGNFEQDYWGFSYKEANSFLLTQFKDEPLRICYVHNPGKYNYWALPDEDKQKLLRVPYDKAEYLITTHRFEKESFNFGKVVFEQQIDGCAIITVYQKENHLP
jgi:hypothetical protein